MSWGYCMTLSLARVGDIGRSNNWNADKFTISCFDTDWPTYLRHRKPKLGDSRSPFHFGGASWDAKGTTMKCVGWKLKGWVVFFNVSGRSLLDIMQGTTPQRTLKIILYANQAAQSYFIHCANPQQVDGVRFQTMYLKARAARIHIPFMLPAVGRPFPPAQAAWIDTISLDGHDPIFIGRKPCQGHRIPSSPGGELGDGRRDLREGKLAGQVCHVLALCINHGPSTGAAVILGIVDGNKGTGKQYWCWRFAEETRSYLGKRRGSYGKWEIIFQNNPRDDSLISLQSEVPKRIARWT